VTALRLNLGCGRNALPGWTNLDRVALRGVDVVADLEAPLPFAADSVETLLMCHVLEHIKDALGLMQELHRIAQPGAQLQVHVPFGASDDAWEDPTHVRPYFLRSFSYFAQPFYSRADYGYRGDWQPERIHLKVMREGNEDLDPVAVMRRVTRERNVVAEMICVMSAVKPIRLPLAELIAPPAITLGFE
jgi:ubiquinone/menaquinone biosynthesis C-methylase UbiE